MPRIPYPDLRGEQLDAATRVREARNGQLHNLFRMLLHSPPVATAWLELGTAFRHHTSLPPDVRELAVCAVAARTGSDYVWHHHSALAHEAGVTHEELLSVRERSHDPGILDPMRRAAVAYADAVAGDTVTQGDLDTVTGALDLQQVVELTALAAYYTGAARFIGALRVDVEHAG